MNESACETNIEEISEEGDPDSIIQRLISDVSYVLSASWLRHAIQNDDGFNRIILGGRRSFLLYFRLFLVLIYITYETFK